MNSSPTVSIVVTCYNSARFLGEALDSVLAQTYRPKVEIVAVDDGSTDKTADILAQFPEVRYVYQPNQGVSAARNLGIQASTGEFLLFHDHDDRLLPEAAATLVQLLEHRPDCAIAVGEHRYIDSHGQVTRLSTKELDGRNDLELKLLGHNFIETPGSCMVRRSALLEVGLFNDSMEGGEDYELYLRLARRYKIVGTSTFVSDYRRHDNNTTGNSAMMLRTVHLVLEMERPHLGADRTKLERLRSCGRSTSRLYGRPLTRQLIGSPAMFSKEGRRNLSLLRRYYPVGFLAALLLYPFAMLKRITSR
jgi:glycosyltransferase involved in cell wall biosynthesis